MSKLELSSADEENSDDDLHSISNENDSITWHYQLAKSLITMYDNMHEIITGFDELLQNTEMDLQQIKIKVEMMRMALILNPSDLSKWNINELNSPCTDLKRLDDYESSLIEQKCYQHEKLRGRINRIIMKLKRGMEKLDFILFNSSYDDKSTYFINNYRKRIETSLAEIRTQMIEYNQINQSFENDELTKHQKIISEMTIKNPLIEERIEDYRMKLKSYVRFRISILF